MVDLSYEQQAANEGYFPVCGVDEAGRGPLAGPVCAAAVILPPDTVITGLDDSKKLTAKKRDVLFDEIRACALAYGVAFASVEEIERLNILQATYLAMRRSIEALSVSPAFALIDGNRIPPDLNVPARAIVGGDGLSASIAAASVLAKVTRDRLMLQMDAQYPGYGFAAHKGYGSRAHCEALRELGPCPIHRMSFLGKILK